jgi:prophage tail gpP-like protein
MTAQYPAVARTSDPAEDEITLELDGRRMAGWTSVRVTRGIERCPNDFDIGLTDLEPRAVDGIVVHPGDSCKLMFGDDLVVTGYVDRVLPRFSVHEHAIRVTGRGKCQDLVDCSAIWAKSQISGSNVFEIALKLAAPYGIGVQSAGDMGDVIPLYNIGYGTTAWQVIEEWCAIRKVLAFETPQGNLQLLNAGSDRIPLIGATDLFREAASGFVESINVISAEAEWSMDQRYSDYRCMRQSTDVFNDLGEGGNLIATFRDAAVSRYRVHDTIAELSNGQGLDNALERAQWEASRRAGRSAVVKLITDSWRDASGSLYEPGTAAVLHVPSVYKEEGPGLGPHWVISEVVYRRDNEQGTTAEVTMMPRAAFAPPPTLPPMVLPPILLTKPPGAARK